MLRFIRSTTLFLSICLTFTSVGTASTGKNTSNQQWQAGVAALNSEKWSEAIAQFDKIIAVEPQEPHAWLNRGFAHHGAEHWEQAISDFNQSLYLSPSNAEAYMWRGMAKKAIGDYDGLVSDVERAAKIDPQYAGVLEDAYSTRNFSRVKWVAVGGVMLMTLLGAFMIARVAMMFRSAAKPA